MKKIFVNCSNHSSDSWSAAQKAAAEIYGEIVDIKFPAVPSDPLAYLKPIVDETFNKIMAYHPVAMMLAGEPVVVARLLRRLQDEEIAVFAAVTDRVSKEVTLPDGTTSKTSVFEFKGFREF